MRVLSVAVVLLSLSIADAFRKKHREEHKDDEKAEDPKMEAVRRQMVERLQAVQRGNDTEGPLIPALVPGAGQIFEVASRERLDILESNEYRWKLVSVTDPTGFKGLGAAGDKQDYNEWFATLDGGYISNNWGWKTTVVKNNEGAPLFKIELAKHMWNIFRWTWSFRVSDAETDKVLYTINKDWWGTGLFWRRDEWRVYRGHKKDGAQIYHCVGSFWGYGFSCYHNKHQYKNSEEPVATMGQSMGRDLAGLPDVFTLKVKENEDTALLLAVSVVVDMVNEQTAKNKEAEERRAAEEREKEEKKKADQESEETQ